tara:strand:- start:308 stop:1174 length:867 start_codon:yes stop_codon:yes gene_type:complete
MGLMKELADLNSIYKSMYSEAKAESPEAEEEKRREDDDLFGSPNAKKKGKKKRWQDDDGDGKWYEKGEVKKEEVVLEKDLSAKERRELPDSDFALPGKGKGPEGKQAGSYPIPDKNHARMALAMVAKYGTSSEKAKVRAAVERKFPGIKVSEELDFFGEVVGFLMITEVAETIQDAEYIMANKLSGEDLEEIKEVLNQLQEKDTYDQVAAVVDYYRSKKGTDDATYDSEHGKKKAAKKERDYAAFERKKMKRSAQRSGHPWEHAKGSTSEKEGKKSEKTKHVRDPQYN